ncbi:MAG TPA: hypothetical protein ENN80_12455, partial [Candidatus Hydrogenedentes bacterium]|nr:hypothetical protein [Candidatus Hydrogenedentota bacterium]
MKTVVAVEISPFFVQDTLQGQRVLGKSGILAMKSTNSEIDTPRNSPLGMPSCHAHVKNIEPEGTAHDHLGSRDSGPTKRTSPRVWPLLVLLVLAGLALRIWYLSERVHAPDFTAPMLDPHLNDYWARAMVTGDWTPPEFAADPQIRSTPYGRPPGYPHVLAAVYRLFGLGYTAPRAVQMALGIVNALLAFFLARALFGNGTGLFAAAFMALYWGFIYSEGELNAPVYLVFLALVFAHALRG